MQLPDAFEHLAVRGRLTGVGQAEARRPAGWAGQARRGGGRPGCPLRARLAASLTQALFPAVCHPSSVARVRTGYVQGDPGSPADSRSGVVSGTGSPPSSGKPLRLQVTCCAYTSRSGPQLPAERAKGQAWGLKTIESFHPHGTPPVA